MQKSCPTGFSVPQLLQVSELSAMIYLLLAARHAVHGYHQLEKARVAPPTHVRAFPDDDQIDGVIATFVPVGVMLTWSPWRVTYFSRKRLIRSFSRKSRGILPWLHNSAK